MSKPLTVEQMARKCFCDLNLCAYGPCTQFDSCRKAWKQFARAARKFVRMENEQKADNEWKKFKAACRKTRRAGK
jgi:hypothetical protein